MPLPVPPPAIGPRSPEPRLTAAVRLRARKPDDAPTSRKSIADPVDYTSFAGACYTFCSPLLWAVERTGGDTHMNAESELLVNLSTRTTEQREE